MKKIFLLSLLCLAALPALAEQVAVSKFVGINNNDNSLVIDPSYAQDALNVDVTPGGRSIKKRSGYGLYKTGFTPSTGVHGGFHGFDSTGNDIQIWESSISVKGIVADGTPNTIVSSATVNSTLDCADTQGSFYCVNSSRDFYIKTNGTSLTQWFTTPLGTIVEATPDRIAVAGMAATPNTISFSGSNAFTNFTVGPLTTDPFSEVIAAPGSKLTNLRWGCGKLLWWKDQSFGYFAFDDQYSAQVKIVSDNIGTFDNTSAIDPGGSVWFRGQDGHVWKYNCSFLSRETTDIAPFVQASGRRTSNSWTQTAQSDFSSGYSVYADTDASSGNVMLAGFNEPFTSFSTWTVVYGSWSATGGVAVSSTNVTYSSSAMLTNGSLTISPTNYYLTMYSKWANADSSRPLTYACAVDTSYRGYCLQAYPVGSKITISIDLINGLDAFSLLATSTTGLGIDTNYHTYSLKRLSNGDMTAYIDGISRKTVTNIGLTQTPTKLYILSNSAIAGGGQDTTIDYLKIYATTGTYQSAVKNAPNLSAWSTFNPTYSNNDGAVTFYTRASTDSFDTFSSTPGWVSQTDGGVVSASTGSYMQVRADFAITAATNTPTLNDFVFNWFDGSASDQAYGIYFDNSIWFSVSYGVGVSSNTYIFKRDLINDGWNVYSFGAGGMLVQNNRLFFGSVGNGNIFQYGTGTSDNGTAINSYWRTKSFSGQDPFLENSFSQLDSYWARNANQSTTVSYTLNASTSPTSYTVLLSSTTQGLIRSKKMLPTGTNGSTIDIKFLDNSASSSWEIFLFRVLFDPFPYRPG